MRPSAIPTSSFFLNPFAGSITVPPASNKLNLALTAVQFIGNRFFISSARSATMVAGWSKRPRYKGAR
jgi:hypothetical protein